MSERPLVVYVDDEVQVLRSLERRLKPRSTAWDMRFFASAAEALEALKGEREAVVVTDWLMPGMDGLELCRRLREAEAGGRREYTYVLILTGRQEVEHTVRALDEGADDFLAKPFHLEELVARIGVGVRILRLQKRLRETNRQLQTLASTDPLTGLSNRRRGVQVLEENLERVGRGKQDLSVILIDLDRFKQVNDHHGHETGDAVLRAAAATIERLSRGYDIAVRWGGDELLVVCPHARAEEAVAIAERLRAGLAETAVAAPDGTELLISASLGVGSAASGERLGVEELVARADTCLYEAKAAGRNVVKGPHP